MLWKHIPARVLVGLAQKGLCSVFTALYMTILSLDIASASSQCKLEELKVVALYGHRVFIAEAVAASGGTKLNLTLE